MTSVRVGGKHRRPFLTSLAPLAAGAAGLACPEAFAQSPAAGARDRPFTFELRARAQYDTNVANGSKALANITGVRPDDIRYSLSGAINATRPVGRQVVFLRGSIGYDFYQYNKDLKRERIDLEGGTGGLLGPCQTGLSGRYSRLVAEDEPLTVADARSTLRIAKSASISTACPVVGNIGVSITGSHAESDTRGGTTLKGNETNAVNVSAFYRSRPLGSFGVFGSYSKSDYSQPAGVVDPVANSGVEVYSAGVNYERPIGNRLTGSASLSRYRVEAVDTPLGVPSTPSEGTSWNVGLTYRVNARMNADLGFSRTAGATSRLGAVSQRQDAIQAGLSYRFSDRLQGSLNASRSERTYPNAAPTPVTVASRETRTRVGGALQLDLGRYTSLSVDASHNDVQTDVSILDYHAERVGVTLSARF